MITQKIELDFEITLRKKQTQNQIGMSHKQI